MGDQTASQFREPSSHYLGLEAGEEEKERSIEGFRESDFDHTQFGTTGHEGRYVNWESGTFAAIVHGIGSQECRKAVGGRSFSSLTSSNIMRAIAKGFADGSMKVFWAEKEVPDDYGGKYNWGNEAKWDLVVRCEMSISTISRVYIWIHSWCGYTDFHDSNSGCSIVWDTCPWNFWMRGLDDRMRDCILEKERIRLAVGHFSKKPHLVVEVQRSFRTRHGKRTKCATIIQSKWRSYRERKLGAFFQPLYICHTNEDFKAGKVYVTWNKDKWHRPESVIQGYVHTTVVRFEESRIFYCRMRRVVRMYNCREVEWTEVESRLN